MAERNEPCPCGSGKKFKKCCMKDFSKGGKFMPVTKENQDTTRPRYPSFVPHQETKLERIALRPYQIRMGLK